MSHDIWEEGTGCSKCEAEHQDGYNALCVKESDEHGGQAHQTHNDFVTFMTDWLDASGFSTAL